MITQICGYFATNTYCNVGRTIINHYVLEPTCVGVLRNIWGKHFTQVNISLTYYFVYNFESCLENVFENTT